jgi:hypothetical protein
MCPEAESVVAYLDGALTPEERARFEAHLPTCASCPGELALLRQTLPLLDKEPKVEPSAQLRRNVLSNLPAAPQGLLERWGLWFTLPMGALTAMALVALVVHYSKDIAPIFPEPPSRSDELALAENLELLQNLDVVESADLTDEDLEAVSDLDKLAVE